MICFDNTVIEELLDKPYWIVDILPKQVPKDFAGQYFTVEKYYLQEPQWTKVRQKYLSVLLKLNCYYDLAVSTDYGVHWNENPDPEKLEECILTGRGSAVHLLSPLENTLMVLNHDDTYMTVYNPTEELLLLLLTLAEAEGLFMWQPEAMKS